MKKLYRVTLTEEERSELKAIIKKQSAKSAQVKRSYILLAVDEHGDKRWKDSQVSQAYHVSQSTVERIRERFVEDGFETVLKGKKREPVSEKVLDGRVEAHLIALRCSNPPEGYAKWSLRLLADKMVELAYVEHISHESVRGILKKIK
ncbi:MAG TPA: helix-turn-helix domain-containing protein [Flavisolibacter sp.]|nr:helix-turn-helix domain-containing protein [Flavisolibacter sp.]